MTIELPISKSIANRVLIRKALRGEDLRGFTSTGWIPSSVRNYEATVSIVEWAISEKLELPSKVPYSLERSHKTICTLGARPYELWHNIKRRFKG